MRGCSMDTYKVKKLNHPINLEIAVPGSKSITNRALFLAALGNGAVHLKGVLIIPNIILSMTL